MIPRRPLLLLTALVLVLHWLVLVGVPRHWDRPAPPSPQVFTTRTLAARPPPPAKPVEPAAAPAPATAAARAPVRRTPLRKKAPARAAPPTTPAPVPSDMQDAIASDTEADAAPAIDTAPPDTEAAPTAPEDSPTPASAEVPAPAPAPPPAPTPDAPAPTPSSARAIDIAPPGAATGAGNAAAPAVRIPPPMRLQFDVSGEAKKFHYSARAELLWQHDGQHYQASQEISVLFLGSRTQTSVGEFAAGGLLPQRFGDRARSEQAAHFDYDQGRVTFSANTPEAPMAVGTQDRLSVFIQLGAMLAAAPERYPTGTRISIATVSARAADVWSFTVENEEVLDLPAGPTPSLKLERMPRRDYDQKAELWLAPALGYLPVRIRITQANGDFADLRLRSHAAP